MQQGKYYAEKVKMLAALDQFIERMGLLQKNDNKSKTRSLYK
jgi:hypothetical protein